MPHHLRSTIPGQGTIQLFGQLACLFDQYLNDAVAVFVTDLGQHHETGRFFYENWFSCVIQCAELIHFLGNSGEAILNPVSPHLGNSEKIGLLDLVDAIEAKLGMPARCESGHLRRPAKSLPSGGTIIHPPRRRSRLRNTHLLKEAI